MPVTSFSDSPHTSTHWQTLCPLLPTQADFEARKIPFSLALPQPRAVLRRRGEVPVRGGMKSREGILGARGRKKQSKTSPGHSANPISHRGMGHKERIEYETRLLSSQGSNSSSFNHQLGKSHQGTDGHTLGLGHINCHHLFSSAEIKGHKILLNINVLLPCEPSVFKDFAGQMPAGQVLVARSTATAGMQPAIFVQKYGSGPPLLSEVSFGGENATFTSGKLQDLVGFS